MIKYFLKLYFLLYITLANEYCTEPCKYLHMDSSNNIWEYDLSNLCSLEDYKTIDDVGHEYIFNICRYSNSICLPADCDSSIGCKPYEVIEHKGIAIQFWGTTPPRVPVTLPDEPCYLDSDPNVEVTCSRPCSVIGVGYPFWNIVDDNNPLLGVSAFWDSLPPDSSDPYQCPEDEYGNPGFRRVTFQFLCDKNESIKAEQLIEDPCAYIITINSAHTCFIFEYKYSEWSLCQPDGFRNRQVDCNSNTSTVSSLEYCSGEHEKLIEPCEYIFPPYQNDDTILAVILGITFGVVVTILIGGYIFRHKIGGYIFRHKIDNSKPLVGHLELRSSYNSV